MRALVTGAGGFVGQWLCQALLRRRWTVSAATLGSAPQGGVLSPEDVGRIAWYSHDLGGSAGRSAQTIDAAQSVATGTSLQGLDRIVEEASPDAIFHLAGIAFAPAAASDAVAAVDVNVAGAVRLLSTVRRYRERAGGDPVILVIGSGEQYGRHDSGTPLTEDAELRPRSTYAASKCAQESFALAYARADSLKVIATRSFNHSGAGQNSSFLLPSLVARALAARREGRNSISIGNTEPVRDFLHVEDVVGAYIALVEKGEIGDVYNVCSGEGVSVGSIAEDVLSAVGVNCSLAPDPALQRPVDVPYLVGDNSKLRAATGWSVSRSRVEIISDLINAAS